MRREALYWGRGGFVFWFIWCKPGERWCTGSWDSGLRPKSDESWPQGWRSAGLPSRGNYYVMRCGSEAKLRQVGSVESMRGSRSLWRPSPGDGAGGEAEDEGGVGLVKDEGIQDPEKAVLEWPKPGNLPSLNEKGGPFRESPHSLSDLGKNSLPLWISVLIFEEFKGIR